MKHRTLFIGDVHGMMIALDQLLGAIELRAGDHLIFLGDLLDKGPDPLGVVRRIGALEAQDDITTTLIRGNHEDKHLRYRINREHRPKIARKQEDTQAALARFHAEAGEDDWAILERSVPFFKLHDLNILAVHGGIAGNLTSFPNTIEDLYALTGRSKEKALSIMRTRFIDHETGAMKALGHEGKRDPFWAEVYDGRFGHVVFGHQPFLDGVKAFPHATGVDTGAVHGGSLSALIFEDDIKPHIIAIDCADMPGLNKSERYTSPDFD